MTELQTEFAFTLPCGYVDRTGTLHKQGTMRLATDADEIFPLRDPRVTSNQAYLVVMLFPRIITQLGTLGQVDTGVVEGLFSADLAYLQDLYRQINENGHTRIAASCPSCSAQFDLEPDTSGGSLATLSTSSKRR